MQKYKPIKFLEPRQTDRTIMVPAELVAHADGGKSHAEDLKFVLALLWSTYVARGEFRVSTKMLDELHGSCFRRKLISILGAVAVTTKNHSTHEGSVRCRTREFKYRRPEQAPTYSGIPVDPSGGPCVMSTAMVAVSIPARWLWDRYERWSEVCKKHGWTSYLDLDGRTDWGRPLLETLDRVEVPVRPETERLTERGVLRAAHRIDGRCYHPLTNLKKEIRRACLIDGEPTAEVDIHACYSCFLVSRLPDGPSKDNAIHALQTDWYRQFEPAYRQWLLDQEAAGRTYRDASGRWMMRLDDDPKHDTPASIKIESQRQCLFWRDGRLKSNPLRETLRRLHPELCDLVEGWRRNMTPSELSEVLTRAEGSMVVDSAMSELERSGIGAITIHDACVVPESRAQEARDVMLSVAEWHLGFRPRISIKEGHPGVTLPGSSLAGCRTLCPTTC